MKITTAAILFFSLSTLMFFAHPAVGVRADEAPQMPAESVSAPAFQANILAEEDVYPLQEAGNGAGPLWCRSSSCVARMGETVYITGLTVLPDAKPLNNCQWTFFRRSDENPDDAKWQLLYTDAARTREPAPLAVLPAQNLLFISAHPTLVADPEVYDGPAKPEIVRVKLPAEDAGDADAHAALKMDDRFSPEWDGEPRFQSHTYRNFVVDAGRGELLLFQNDGYTHGVWTLFVADGENVAKGRLAWPWGDAFVKPGPIRICYPVISLADRRVFLCGVSAHPEPNPEWKVYRKELTGSDWDYDLSRLFFTWTEDVTTAEFASWLELATCEKTGGRITVCDMFIAPDGETVHVLWTQTDIDTRLREKFFPDARQEHSLRHAVIRRGEVLRQNVLHRCGEGQWKPICHAAQFHPTPDGRLFILYNLAGLENDDGKSPVRQVSENRLAELNQDGFCGESQILPFREAFTQFFTATPRTGNTPSFKIDILGHSDNRKSIRYACVEIIPHS